MATIAGKEAWAAWIELARNGDILRIAQTLGARLKKTGTAEWEGPCPQCGGRDRFSINVKKRVCNCRKCGLTGNVIALVEAMTGGGFLEACEYITNTPRPDRTRDESPEDRISRLEATAKRNAEFQRRQEEQRTAEEARAKRDEQAISDVVDRAVALEGTYGEEYLRGRGLVPHKRYTKDIKFVADLDYWGTRDNGTRTVVHLATLPAIVALIRDFSNAVIGISQTYLDPYEPRKWKPEGSPTNSPKKIRGEKGGGMIRLGQIGETLAISEGWENCLAWHQLGGGPEDVTLAAAVDLGNLAGGATGPWEHPVLKDHDGKRVRIKNGIPDPNHRGIILPKDIKAIILLADLDSETYATAAHLLVAGRRFRNEGIQVDIAWPDPDKDWNDLLIAELGDERAPVSAGAPLPNY